MKWRSWLAAMIASVTSYSVAAPAHSTDPSIQGERVVELRLDEDPIRIGYRIALGAKLAAVEQSAADRDQDGNVTSAEGNQRLDERTRELLENLEICTGMKLAALECRKLEPGAVERVEAEGWEPQPNGHLHFGWTLALRQRASEIGAIRLDDGWDFPGIEISDFRILPPRHAQLELAGEADRSQGVADRVSFIEQRRPPGPRQVVAVWAAPRPSPRRKIALLVIIAAVLAAGGFWASRRRSS